MFMILQQRKNLCISDEGGICLLHASSKYFDFYFTVKIPRSPLLLCTIKYLLCYIILYDRFMLFSSVHSHTWMPCSNTGIWLYIHILCISNLFFQTANVCNWVTNFEKGLARDFFKNFHLWKIDWTIKTSVIYCYSL